MLFSLFKAAEGDGDFEVDYFLLPGFVLEIGADPFFGDGDRDHVSSGLHLPILPDTIGATGLTDLGGEENLVGLGLPAAVVLPPAGDPVLLVIDFYLSGLQVPAGPGAGDIAGDIMPQ